MAEVTIRREAIRPLSETARRRIEAIRDEDIDYSDIPPLDDNFLKGAVRGRFYRPMKKVPKETCGDNQAVSDAASVPRADAVSVKAVDVVHRGFGTSG